MVENNIEIRNIYIKLKGGIFDFKGKSMEPTLKEGDKLKVYPVKPEDINPGDIVIFNRGILACHRVLGIFKKNDRFYFWEKGDNSNAIGYISEDEIMGRVGYTINNGVLIRPKFFINKGIIIFFLMGAFINFYIKVAKVIKKYLFFEKKNILSHILGKIIWSMYYFYFKGIIKNSSNLHFKG
jgi:signal peptidase I